MKISRNYEESYFKQRGVSKDIYEKFFLGDALSLDSFFPHFLVNKPVFPVYDIIGELKGFTFRVGEEKCKYFNYGFKKTEQLYGIYFAQDEILKKDCVYIVEGFFDVLIPFSYGINNVVSIFGNTISEKQIMILASLTNNFILALDSDNSGISGAEKSEKLIKKLFPSVNISRQLLYPYKDFGEYILHSNGIVYV